MLMAVLRIVATDKICQVLVTQRICFRRVLNVGSVVTYPDVFRPRVTTGRFIVEREDVCFNALRTENTRR